ncbi:MAG: hypothetical protein ACLU6B_06050 [Lachnospirales bacterium]
MAFRVVTLRLPQLIRVGLAVLGILIVALLCFLFFRPSAETPAAAAETYYPGLYTSSVQFGAQTVCVEVIMNASGIESVSYQIPTEISEVYPLVAQTSADIEEQVRAGNDPATAPTDSAAQDTANYLLAAIETAKDKALR